MLALPSVAKIQSRQVGIQTDPTILSTYVCIQSNCTT